MTTYEKELIDQLDLHYKSLTTPQLVSKLMEMGVIDYSRCKVLSVREYVRKLTREGCKKTNAMWDAAEKFACSYEYIRKCIYYYKDVNLC